MRREHIGGCCGTTTGIERGIAFVTAPAIIGAREGIGRTEIDFFKGILANIADPHVTSLAIKTPAVGIAQTQGEYLIAKRISGGDAVVG